MGFISIQNDFTHGEIDERAQARFDLDLYKKACSKLRNVFVQPYGGVTRRFGTDYISTISANEDEYRITSFDYDSSTHYLFIFTNLKLDIYYEDTLVATKVTTYIGSDVTALQFTQTFNKLVITHPSYAPMEISRTSAHNGWTTPTPIAFKNPAAYDFKHDYASYTFSINPTTINDVTLTPVTLTSSIAMFTDDYVGGYFVSLGLSSDVNLGFFRATSLGGPSPSATIKGNILSSFNSTYSAANSMLGSNCILTEKAFSDDRGYPSACLFYEGRLFLANTPSLPESVFSSKSNYYDDFDIGTGEANDSIQVTLSASSGAALATIKYIIGSKNLHLFTDVGEYTVPQLSEDAITPGNVSFRPQSFNGVGNVPPQVIDSIIVYVGRDGKRVYTYQYDNTVGGYVSVPISLLSSHLINLPVDNAVMKGISGDASQYYFLVNSDGTLACLQLVTAQDVIAWSLSTTDGYFKRIAKVGDDVYFLVKRTIEEVDYTFLEKANFDHYMDSCFVYNGASTRTITGLTHLIGKTVKIIGNGFLLTDKVVQTGGIVTIPMDEPEVTSAVIGLGFNPIVTTLPLNVETQIGSIAFTKKRFTRIFVKYYQSLGIQIEGNTIPHLEFGNHVLGQPPEPKSGLFEHVFANGWDPSQTVTITQTEPAPFHILAIGLDATF